MFDQYMLVENTLTNRFENGKSFIQVGIRFPHHCGIWVSIIEKIELSIDGRNMPEDDMYLILHDNEYKVTELEAEYEDRWNFSEIALLRIMNQTLSGEGFHDLELMIGLRVSFLDWLLTGSNKKRMKLCT